MQLLSIFLMMDPQGKGGSSGTLIMMGLMILVFWLFMIRPQAKKAKKQKEFINNLQKGDKIVTIAGIHGKVNKVNDDSTLELETSPGSYIKIERSAISMEWTANINKPVAEVKK
ncbi:MAG: preprotein translocase subunit YajC [Ferruginibacter sp.]|jgi:preprotein translocase subunit YajC